MNFPFKIQWRIIASANPCVWYSNWISPSTNSSIYCTPFESLNDEMTKMNSFVSGINGLQRMCQPNHLSELSGSYACMDNSKFRPNGIIINNTHIWGLKRVKMWNYQEFQNFAYLCAIHLTVVYHSVNEWMTNKVMYYVD